MNNQTPAMQFKIEKDKLKKFVCCSCNSEDFISTIKIYFMGKIVSPTGQETILSEPSGVCCHYCGKFYSSEDVSKQLTEDK